MQLTDKSAQTKITLFDTAVGIAEVIAGLWLMNGPVARKAIQQFVSVDAPKVFGKKIPLYLVASLYKRTKNSLHELDEMMGWQGADRMTNLIDQHSGAALQSNFGVKWRNQDHKNLGYTVVKDGKISLQDFHAGNMPSPQALADDFTKTKQLALTSLMNTPGTYSGRNARKTERAKCNRGGTSQSTESCSTSR